MGSSGKDAVRDAKKLSNAQMKEQKAMQATAKAAVEKQKQEYKNFEFKNPYDNLSTENFAEDLTVNQQQAQFQAQQGQQQRANIMQDMRGAAGSSGIAGLAQAMASQGQLQTQQISASIGQQEQANQKLKIAGAERVAGVEMQKASGDAMVQQAESGREATLLGMEYGELQGAQAGVQQAYGAQQSAAAMELERVNANKAMTGQIIGGVLGAVGSFAGAGGFAGAAAPPAPSDRRLKKNINKIGESPSGLNIYSFEYKNPINGNGLFQGVMSDEIPQEAVGTRDGYDTVDYSMLDVEFKQI
jgi:hypothetical protein